MHPHRSAPHAPTQFSIRSTHTGQHHMHTHRSASAPHSSASNHMHPHVIITCTHIGQHQHHMHTQRSAPHAPAQFSIMSTHICQHHLHLHMLLQSFLSSFFTAYMLSFKKLHITGLTSKTLLTRTLSTHRLILFIVTDWCSESVYEYHNLFTYRPCHSNKSLENACA